MRASIHAVKPTPGVRAHMADLPGIEMICVRVYNMLQHYLGPTDLLRTARLLKAATRNLRAAAEECSRTAGNSLPVRTAFKSLEQTELHLRELLLEHPAMQPSELREHLSLAVDASFEALESLQLVDQTGNLTRGQEAFAAAS
jgi:hypothetical protein